MEKRRKYYYGQQNSKFNPTRCLTTLLIVLFVFWAFGSSWFAFSLEISQEPQIRYDSTAKLGRQKNLVFGKKVAIGITVTKDGPYLDGAAVLVQSILEMDTTLEMDIVAIVHPGVQTTRQSLKDIGFKIYEFDPPIESSEIRGKHLRETIDKSGCCGALELLKLRGFQLMDYSRVLLLDMDSMILKNIDHLFTADSRIGLQFTWDFAMDNKNSNAPPVQGGFLLLKPDLAVYEELISIVREGDFRPGTGWHGSRIGWCWGGQNVQGLLAYYYSMVRKDEGKPLDECLYNAMDTLPERCTHVRPTEVFTAHFTVCQKPWECHRGRKGLCEYLHSFWWGVRQNLERTHNLKESSQCCRGCAEKKYHALNLGKMVPIWP